MDVSSFEIDYETFSLIITIFHGIFQDAAELASSQMINNLYAKKPNPVTSTSDAAAISIDISSDEDDDDAPKDPEPTGSKTGPKPPIIPADPPQLPPPSTSSASNKVTNGAAKPFDSLLDNTIESALRPGPASQKKRKLEPPSNGPQSIAPSKSFSSSQQQSSSGSSSKPKKFKKEVYATRSSVTFADVGGADKVLKELCELIMHIKHPEMYRHIGLPPPRGILLSGPPGSGKTLLAHAIAGQLDVLLVEVPATELIAGVSGESEERIREIFEQATAFAPCVLFIDEIDAVSSNRQNASKDMERRVVSQLLSSLDNMSKCKYGDEVLVIGATNRPDVLDPALRRVGRFDHEISLGIPDRGARAEILSIISRNLKIDEAFDYDEIASLTPGYVAADLLALTTRAALTAIKRVIRTKEDKVEEVKQDVEVVEETEKPVEQPQQVPVVAEVVANTIEEEKMDVDETMKIPDELIEPTPASIELIEPAPAPVEPVPAVIEPLTAEKVTMEVEESQVAATEPASVDEVQKLPIIPPLAEMKLDDMLKWLQTDSVLIEEEELRKMTITRDDFVEAIKHTQPSAKREGFVTVPDVTW